jgi:hypothetical protein
MSRRFIMLQTAITVVLVSFGSLGGVNAQQNAPLSGGSPAMSYSRELLKRQDVQNELALDANQKDALAKLLTQSQIVVRSVVVYRDTSSSDEGREQRNAESGRQTAAQTAYILKERQREVEEILRPDQRKRLTEIDLQWRGILALGDKNVSDRLGVSPAHHQRIRAILADFFVKRLRLLSPSEKTEDIDLPRYQERRMLLHETEQKVLALLSDEEKSRWTQAVGQPFVFEK